MQRDDRLRNRAESGIRTEHILYMAMSVRTYISNMHPHVRMSVCVL